jgi:hypothetical protein
MRCETRCSPAILKEIVINTHFSDSETLLGVQTGVQLARFLVAKIGLNGAESTVS